jgi:hypothetical protein
MASETEPSDKMLFFSRKPIVLALVTIKCNVLNAQRLKKAVSYTTHIKLNSVAIISINYF